MGLDAVIKTKDKDLVYFRNKYYLHRFISNLFPDLESTDLKCELTRKVIEEIKKELKSFIKEREKELNNYTLIVCFFNEDDLNEAKEVFSKLCILLVKSKHEKYFYEGNFLNGN